MSNTSKTDWSKIDAMTDEDIDTSDIPPLSEEFFASSKLRLPLSISRAYEEVIDFFAAGTTILLHCGYTCKAIP